MLYKLKRRNIIAIFRKRHRISSCSRTYIKNLYPVFFCGTDFVMSHPLILFYNYSVLYLSQIFIYIFHGCYKFNFSVAAV